MNTPTYLLLIFVAVSCSEFSPTPSGESEKSQSEPAVSADDPGYEYVSLSIEGMSCAENCAPKVAETLEALPEVARCEVDFDSKIAKCHVKKGTKTEQLSGAFEGSRFMATTGH